MSERIDYREDENLRELLRRAEGERLAHDEEELDEDYDVEEYEEDEEDEYEEYEDESEEYYEDEVPEEAEIESSPSTSESTAPAEHAGLFGIAWPNTDRLVFAIILVVTVSLTALWKSYYNSSIRRLAETEEALKDLRYRHLQSTAEMISLEKVSKIEEGIAEHQLNLEHSTQPPYYVIDTLQPAREE